MRETLQALLHQLRTLERWPLAGDSCGSGGAWALYLFAHAIAALSLATMYTTTYVWSLIIGTRSGRGLRSSALDEDALFVSAYVSERLSRFSVVYS